jgi:hypothetical protein
MSTFAHEQEFEGVKYLVMRENWMRPGRLTRMASRWADLFIPMTCLSVLESIRS